MIDDLKNKDAPKFEEISMILGGCHSIVELNS